MPMFFRVGKVLNSPGTFYFLGHCTIIESNPFHSLISNYKLLCPCVNMMFFVGCVCVCYFGRNSLGISLVPNREKEIAWSSRLGKLIVLGKPHQQEMYLRVL